MLKKLLTQAFEFSFFILIDRLFTNFIEYFPKILHQFQSWTKLFGNDINKLNYRLFTNCIIQNFHSKNIYIIKHFNTELIISF